MTDKAIEHLTEEAESGSTQLHFGAKGPRPMGSVAARMILVRLDPEQAGAGAPIRARAESEHANISEVIRDALRAWLRSA